MIGIRELPRQYDNVRGHFSQRALPGLHWYWISRRFTIRLEKVYVHHGRDLEVISRVTK